MSHSKDVSGWSEEAHCLCVCLWCRLPDIRMCALSHNRNVWNCTVVRCVCVCVCVRASLNMFGRKGYVSTASLFNLHTSTALKLKLASMLSLYFSQGQLSTQCCRHRASQHDEKWWISGKRGENSPISAPSTQPPRLLF